MPGTDSPVIREVQRARQAMLARDAAMLNRVVREYMRVFRELQAEMRALLDAIRMGEIDKAGLGRLAALEALSKRIETEVTRYAHDLAEQLNDAMRLEIEMAGIDAFGLAQAGLSEMDLAALWNTARPEQVFAMFGFTTPEGPLAAMLRNQFGRSVAEMIRQQLIAGFIRGMHPNRVAALLARATGIGLDWALNFTRTAMIWAYRAGTWQTYMNNSQVVRGWYWWAALDERVCMGCVAKHGSFHPVTEILADHHRGRCTQVPKTATYAELGLTGLEETPLNIQAGEEWFRGLSAAQQQKMMGGAMWRAWQDGAFEFGQLSRPYTDPIYGQMWREASLKEILGTGAAQYY